MPDEQTESARVQIRVACLDAEGFVVDSFVVYDGDAFLDFATKAAVGGALEARWPGGIYALADRPPESSVGLGWQRLPSGAWKRPLTPLEERIAAVNASTAGRIAAGFEFRGQRVSLSEVSQITISNAYTIRDTLPYPLPWSTLDDSGFVVMESAKDVAELYAAATRAVLEARTLGNVQKQAAREAFAKDLAEHEKE